MKFKSDLTTMSGTYLLVDIDECSSSPCFNGATCWHETDIYHCNCSAGYDGTNCETGTMAFFNYS